MSDKPRFTPSGFVVDMEPAFAPLQLRSIADEVRRRRLPVSGRPPHPAPQVGAVRVRQHVNPLSSRNLEVLPPPDWPALFPQPEHPLVLDLGCGSGRFLLALGEKDGGVGAEATHVRNYLGLEIRGPLAVRADGWARQLQLPHVRFLATNANVNAPTWLAAYPGRLELVSILHPDPHWKRKHHKRRIVQPALARALAERLSPGGQVFLQSDVKAVAQDMVSVFQAVAGDLLQLSPLHFGDGASPDWPPPEAERVNQGDDEQRNAMRRAAVRRKRKARLAGWRERAPLTHALSLTPRHRRR